MVEHRLSRPATTAFAFRGYNLTNLGRSDELLAHAVYGPVVAEYLERASRVCASIVNRPIHLVQRVQRREEPTLAEYDEAIAVIVAMELAQIDLLKRFHGVDYEQNRLAFGYSLGEVVALSASGAFDMEQGLVIPLTMAKDCAELAENVTLGVLFSRGKALKYDEVTRLCQFINSQGEGVVGVSAVLSPNTLLLIGQGDTLERLKAVMHDFLHPRTNLKLNPNRWPPLHTPIVWQRAVPNRAAVLLHTLQTSNRMPRPTVFSLVTGSTSYNEFNVRETLHAWVDHPQRLWDAICYVHSAGIETVVHVGPEPNLVPATFRRVRDNVLQQTAGAGFRSLGTRAFSTLAGRQWLSAILPARTALLRAPRMRHIILEDWLLENEPAAETVAPIVLEEPELEENDYSPRNGSS